MLVALLADEQRIQSESKAREADYKAKLDALRIAGHIYRQTLHQRLHSHLSITHYLLNTLQPSLNRSKLYKNSPSLTVTLKQPFLAFGY